MFKKLLTTRSLCLSAIIAALYAALTLLLAPISYGPVQLRLSEAFTVLPMVLPQSIPGLFVGCLIANIFNPSPSIFDIVFGSLTTLLAAYGTYKLRNKPILPRCGERPDRRHDGLGAFARVPAADSDWSDCLGRVRLCFRRHGAADSLEIARGL